MKRIVLILTVTNNDNAITDTKFVYDEPQLLHALRSLQNDTSHFMAELATCHDLGKFNLSFQSFLQLHSRR
ncbi:MAG: hypothetical protein J5J00_03070 [Deltaproteobacteria bacterium]|nr:hypothetical protein [Deltaproteobacteria bacterium]